MQKSVVFLYINKEERKIWESSWLLFFLSLTPRRRKDLSNWGDVRKNWACVAQHLLNTFFPTSLILEWVWSVSPGRKVRKNFSWEIKFKSGGLLWNSKHWSRAFSILVLHTVKLIFFTCIFQHSSLFHYIWTLE